MTSVSQSRKRPGPGDVVIGIKVHCGATTPGLDGKYERSLRFSYRSPKEPPLPPDCRPEPPKSPGGAYPMPYEPFRPGGHSGYVKDEDGVVWFDVQLYGTPPDGKHSNWEGGEADGRGDDSEDIASRIADAVANARRDGVIGDGEISVEHNGLSDVDEKSLSGRPQKCPDDKPQGGPGGRGRIILRNPSHYDVRCQDQKIEITVIPIPGDGGSTGIDITPKGPNRGLPPTMPNDRPGYDWIKPSSKDAIEPKKWGPAEDEAQPYLDEKYPWRSPPWKPRRWQTKKMSAHSGGGGTGRESGRWGQPVALPYLRVGVSRLGVGWAVNVPVSGSRDKQMSDLARAFSAVGLEARLLAGRLHVRPRGDAALQGVEFYCVMRGLPWHMVFERSRYSVAYRESASLSGLRTQPVSAAPSPLSLAGINVSPLSGNRDLAGRGDQ